MDYFELAKNLVRMNEEWRQAHRDDDMTVAEQREQQRERIEYLEER